MIVVHRQNIECTICSDHCNKPAASGFPDLDQYEYSEVKKTKRQTDPYGRKTETKAKSIEVEYNKAQYFAVQ